MQDNALSEIDKNQHSKASIRQVWKELKIFFGLLKEAERRRLVFLFVFLTISALVEILTIASLPLYVGLISDPEFLTKQNFLWLSELLSSLSFESVIFYGGVIIVCLFALRTLISVSVLSYQQSLVFSFFKRVFVDLFGVYIDAPLAYHLGRHSSFAFRNFNRGVPTLAVGLLNPLLNLGLNLFLLLTVAIFILWQEPLLAGTVLFSIALILFGFNNWTTHRVKLWGDKGQAQHQKSMKIMQDSFNAVQEIKLGLKEHFYKNRLENSIEIQTDSARKASLINMIAPSVTEMLAVFTIFLLVGYLSLTSGSFIDTLPIITLFIVGIMRLKTYASGMIQAFSKISFNVAVVDSIASDLNELTSDPEKKEEELSNEKLLFKKSLVLNDVCFSFESSAKKSIDNLSLEIKAGEKIAIVGSSGSGKTTLLRVLAGLLPKTSGEILVDEKAVESNFKEWFSNFAFLQQDTSIIDDSILRNIALGFGDREINYERLDEVVNLCGLTSYIEGLADGLSTEIGENGARLSGGQRQRIGLARALYKECKILLFDEPTSSLDVETEKLFIEALLKIIREKNMTLIMVTHRMESLKYCDRVFQLLNGSLHALSPPYEFLDHDKERTN